MPFDRKYWPGQKEFTSWQAAYLFNEDEPVSPARFRLDPPPEKTAQTYREIVANVAMLPGRRTKRTRNRWDGIPETVETETPSGLHAREHLIKFAEAKGMRPGFLFDAAPDALSARERHSLACTIGALALALIKQQRGSLLGTRDQPNVSQIATAAHDVIKDAGGRAPQGVANSTLRERIAAGLKEIAEELNKPK